MKKSEQYQYALMAVLLTSYIRPADKLQIIETLMIEKRLAELNEKSEGVGMD